ncbi:hypothetical protein AX17_003958 [Amanita inopinata Kibby_2008]|nr:hypothetical protein AX17_003958 [Amanita inopinata Kibby_2008]
MDVVKLVPLPPERDDDVSGSLSNPSTMSEHDSESFELDDTHDAPDDEAVSNSQLEIFSATLAQAQRIAEDAEREKRADNKRPRFYQGNSERNKRRKRQQGREMEQKGCCSVLAYFAHPNAATDSRPVVETESREEVRLDNDFVDAPEV